MGMLSLVVAQFEGEPIVRWQWIVDHLDDVWSRGLQHVVLTGSSVTIGLAIAFPLAVLASRHRWTIPPVTWAIGILYTIPSFAFIFLLLPITGLSQTTVGIPLVAYSILILFRNTLAGLDSVEADVREAAIGMGLSRRQVLWRVEVPLAVPVIIAGVRIAIVSAIGLVTIAALIGRGGFGQFILLGLDTFFPTPLLLGVVLSVALAILADLLLLGLQRLVTPWSTPGGTRTVAT
ncbi:MAG: ABC transporter permease [Actinomycetota bacterium]|nr:ABC transporter permease [Actinomycetota bacterium]MDH5224068.1 ABC transporter permease [Actinomycetota bacterium]MDH5314302.1 ABC transporter permease [Actinomycetota bacterium]